MILLDDSSFSFLIPLYFLFVVYHTYKIEYFLDDDYLNYLWRLQEKNRIRSDTLLLFFYGQVNFLNSLFQMML